VGTIAGDDTCVAIARNSRDAALLADELADLVG
jgi:arginine repressor